MWKNVALTGLFPTRDLALRAGEKLRETVGRRGLVRVLFPGATGSLVAVSVLPSSRGAVAVAVGAVLIGAATYSA